MNLAIVDDNSWTNKMDPAADAAAADIMKAGGIEAMSDALDLLSNEPPARPWPSGLKAFVDHTGMPEGVDQERINVAQEWFTTWSAIGTATVFCASLPETYCLPGIAQLLFISGGLTDHVTRRIRMTGQMLFDVMTPGGITDNSLAVRSLRRTRLMHAALRCMRLNPELGIRSRSQVSGQRAPLVWTDEFGQPINQLELVYTLMTFSHVVLRSADRLGIVPVSDKIEAYIYAWNVAGRLIGIDPDLLPDSRAEAALLFERIKATHARAIEGTPQLIAALEESWRRQFAAHHWPLAAPAMHALFETLLTPATRQMLSIAPPPRMQEEASLLLIPALEAIVRADDECFRLLPPAAHLAAAINHFFATSETDNAEDGSLYNSSRHMRAWFDQVRTLKAHP
jgi:hypothetical protein